ncbi:MAG: hypothetical protein Q9213_005762 [Squamulea squamosa]
MEGRAKFSRMYSPPDLMSKALQDYNNSKADVHSSVMLRRILPKSRKPRICVVGAGVAGLRCAQVLSQGGLDVTILEARDRVGGRVGTLWKGGGLIPQTISHGIGGPNWIHGLKENPILNLAKQLGDALMNVPEVPPSVYDQTGHLLSMEEGRQCSELMWGIIEEAFKYSDQEADSIPPNQSLLDYFKLKLKEMDIPKATTERVLKFCQSWGDYIGGDIDRQSLKYLWLEQTIDGGNVFLASTYKAILDRITNDVTPEVKVQLCTKVTSISSPSSESYDDPGTEQSITVTTSENATFNFDEVVMTAPLGWLKHNTTAFQPTLPLRLEVAIRNLSYGALEKVYLTFPSAFWISSGDKEGPKPFFNQWLAPEYTPHHWAVECAFLSSLPAPHSQPTLLFYLHGALATYITTIASRLDPSSSAYLTALSDFFKPYYSLLPNYNSTSPSCSPSHALATNWQNDEFAGWGSYSNFQISDPKKDGKVDLDKDIEALREGASERRLWFAGEHTAPFVALGTVTGAWLSGEGVAKRILRAYGVQGGEEVGGGDDDGGKVGGVVEEGKVAVKRGGTGLGV